MISLKKSFVYKDLCYLMSLWSVKLPVLAQGKASAQGIAHATLVEVQTKVGIEI